VGSVLCIRDSDGTGEEAQADVEPATPGSCASTVLEALGHVAVRVYREGVASERTASALHMIRGSTALRRAGSCPRRAR
jgi:hypothetical protein